MNGDVVVFNGDVAVRSGAEIGGDLVTQALRRLRTRDDPRPQTKVATKFDYDMGGFAGRFVWWLGYTVSVLILGLLLLAFAPHLDEAVVETIRARLGSSIGWGVALFFLLPIVAVFLLVTVVRVALGTVRAVRAGSDLHDRVHGVTHGVGRLVMRSSSRYVAFLIGLVILRALALIPISGASSGCWRACGDSACSRSRSALGARRRRSRPPGAAADARSQPDPPRVQPRVAIRPRGKAAESGDETEREVVMDEGGHASAVTPEFEPDAQHVSRKFVGLVKDARTVDRFRCRIRRSRRGPVWSSTEAAVRS